LREGGVTSSQRLAFAFRLATGRAPDARELGILQKSLDGMLVAYGHDEKAVRGLVGVDGSAELAAYTAVANIILNMDETITKG
jgi:hypothetical protein